jgi:hypothetical protein
LVIFIHLFLYTSLVYLAIFFSSICYDYLLCLFVPVKIYDNAEAEKSKILKENQNKSCIYMWTNLTNGKRYIGSSVDLRDRMYSYFNIKYLQRSNFMYICRALLKHGILIFLLQFWSIVNLLSVASQHIQKERVIIQKN